MTPSGTRRPWVNGLLFALTVLSVFGAGVFHLSARTMDEALWNGVVFAASVMGILCAHEAGHYLMARKNRVDASLPYFIPVPPFFSLFGTLGAVIVMRGRIRSRDALMEVGAAGPLAGMAVALPLLLVGLARCPLMKIPEAAWMEGQSLLYLAAKSMVVGPIPPGWDVALDRSPMAFAGWFGMLITMLNLLPIGQLDGGHIFYALFGDLHEKVSRLFHRLLFAFGLGVATFYGLDAYGRGLAPDAVAEAAIPGFSWIFLGIIMAVAFRRKGFSHPPTDDRILSPRGRAVGIACLVLFAVTFMPVVMRPIV